MTGRTAFFVPITLLYVAYLAYLVFYDVAQGARHIEVTAWDVRLVADAPASALSNLLFGLLLSGPVVLVTAAYALLAFRLTDRAQKSRTSLIASGFLFLFGVIFVC